LAATVTIAEVAKGGHEAAVYPSYYPHEITIETMALDRAANLLRDSKIGAYVGHGQRFQGEMPATIRAVESLGDFVRVRINPASPLAEDKAQTCTAVETVVRDISGTNGLTYHPYPVTPFHGDYLYHVDRAEAAKARLLAAPVAAPPARLTIRVDPALAGLARPEWRSDGPVWDVAVESVDAASLVVSTLTSLNGWFGPPWLKAGWFQAVHLLRDAIDTEEGRQHAGALQARLEAGDYRDSVERINLERELVAAVAGGCREIVAGYRVKRQYFSAEFTEGIENIGFDAFMGLNSPMFVRTVKLKNFPWNGSLVLGIDGRSNAAWNPIAGFDDEFGCLMWAALGDPALLPAPYDSGWMLNRVSDVQAKPLR
jgi:hypothetical protein